MQKRKLQVFVSSTFIDLKEERQSAVEAILNAGHIPAGMELFKAGDESQWNIIKDWIEESDVYMLILGGRYGSIEPKSGKSYTQLEYEYAIELGKPFFAIVIKDDWTDKKAKKKGVKIEDFKEVHNLNKLQEFKATVLTKIVKFAEDLKDIKLAVGESLNEMSRRENLKGWVKADDINYGKSLDELARLSKENDELKSKLAELNKEEKINGLPILEMVDFLKNNIFDSNDSLLYRMNGKKFRSNNSLELLMGLAKEPYHKSENALKNKTVRFLMNQRLITSDAILTENGLLLFTYVEQNKIQWHNNIEYEVPFMG
jgi:hypothetical protein